MSENSSTSAEATETDGRTRPAAATWVGVLAVLGVVGAVVMIVSHVYLDLPMIAAGFAVGAVLFGVTAWGVLTLRSWAWPVAVVVNGLAFVSAVMPWRGIESSGPPALVTLVALGLLLSPAGRQALLYGPRGR